MTATVFRDVTVVPMDGDRLLPHHTVVVRGDRIESVRPHAHAVVPPDAVVIDGSGRYLMPGLVDMHVHYNSRRYGLLFVANGVTTVRNMFGTQAHLEMRAAAATASRPGPTIYTTGPLMDGNPPAWADPAIAVIETPEQAEASVAAQKRDGYDFLKTYTRLYLAAFDAITAAAKRHDMRVVGHLPEHVPLVHAVQTGLESIEHAHSFLPALQSDTSPLVGQPWSRQMFHHADETKIPEVAAQVQRAGAWACPTLVVNEKASLAAVFDKQLQRAEMQFLPPAVIEYWRGLSAQYGFTPETMPLFERALEVQRSLVAGLHAAGVRLLLGTDSNMPLVAWGFSIHDELRCSWKLASAPTRRFVPARATRRNSFAHPTSSVALPTVCVRTLSSQRLTRSRMSRM